MFGAMTTQERSGAGSVAFDRAAHYYDATRGLTAEATARTVQILRAELYGRKCLEIGVGTGRIGLPLFHAGVQMTGLDLSMPMMRKLVEKGRRRSLPTGARHGHHFALP